MRRIGWLIGAAALLALGADARAETQEVRIGIQFGLAYLPIIVADAEGIFAEKAAALGVPGLRVALPRFSGSAPMNEALLSNSVDIGAYGPPGLLIAWEKTKGRQGIKGISGLAATVNTLFTSKAAVTSLADFGAQDRIAVNALNSPVGIMLQMAAEQRFGTGQFARLQNLTVVMPHPEATTALLSGATITAYFATPPYAQKLAKDKRIHALVSSKELFGGQDPTTAVLGAGTAFVEKNPVTVRVVVAALDEAMQRILRDPHRAAEIYVAKEEPGLDLAEAESNIRDGSTSFDITPSGTMKFAEFMIKNGMLKSMPGAWQDVFFTAIHDRRGS